MIPISLEITNFLSYRETAVLNFDGIHLACISGPNGAGKSSLLDAMTWSLFGRSRTRSDDDLVNRIAALEDATAEVRFTFELEGVCYRVMRQKRARRSTSLELQIATGEGGWKTLSEGGVRETQAAIEALLRMNYDTFTNASFLLQGKADEFTTKTPNQRKEILADLLGVSEWDRYRDAAAVHRRETESQLLLRDGRLADIETELSEEPQRRADLEAAQAARTAIVERLRLKEEVLDQMRQTAAAIEQQKQMVKNLQNSVERAQRNLESAQRTRDQRRQERDHYAALLTRSDEIGARFATWQQAEETLQAWQARADSYHALERERRPYELTLTQARSRLEQQLKTLQAQAQRVEQAAEQRKVASQELANTTARLTQLKEKLSQIAAQEDALHAERAALQHMRGERELWQKELAQLQARARQIQTLTRERAAISASAAEARDALSALSEQISAVTEQQQRHATVQAEMDNLKNNQSWLRNQTHKIRSRMDRLEAVDAASACPLCGQPLSESHRTTVLQELQAEGKELAGQFRGNQARVKQLEVEVKQLEAGLRSSSRLERDQQAQQQRLAKAEARLEEIELAQKDWEASGAGRLVELGAALADETAVTTQQTRVNELEDALRVKAQLSEEQQDVQRKVSATEARLAEIERITQEWHSQGAPQLAQAKQQLAEAAYAQEAQQALAELDERIAALGYDASAHQSAREARDALADAPEQQQQLRQAEAAVKPLEDALKELDERIGEQQANLAEQQTQLETAQQQLETLSTGSSDLRAVEDEVFHLREEEIAAAQSVGAAHQRLQVLDDLRAQRKRLTAEKQALTQRLQRLKMLEKAFGRTGVQSLLIETAMPEIEERANELLERLTGGGMRVSFETQRQLKTRDALVETLDIHISDKDGERPYDNYSGGEQFRVNFAVRLALSQLLARRAGARLQTLVIDEGFGSQDPQGRQRLVEAINTVQDDFACVLVITHIDELRDAFPTRIEVTKENQGSTLSVQ